MNLDAREQGGLVVLAPAWDLRLEGSRRVTGVSPRRRAEEVGV